MGPASWFVFAICFYESLPNTTIDQDLMITIDKASKVANVFDSFCTCAVQLSTDKCTGGMSLKQGCRPVSNAT